MTKREPTSVTRIGRYTIRIFDETAYRENIRQYYGNDTPSINRGTTPQGGGKSRPFEKKKPSARFDWVSWHEPMIKGA